MKFFTTVTVILIILKLFELIDITWTAAIVPMFIPLISVFTVFILGCSLAGILLVFRKLKKGRLKQ